MEISVHNVRQVYASSDLVNQSHRGELTHGQGVAPSPVVPEKPGDTSKVVFSKEAEDLKNDLQEKSLDQRQEQKEKENTNQEEEVIDLVTPTLDVGVNLDVNG